MKNVKSRMLSGAKKKNRNAEFGSGKKKFGGLMPSEVKRLRHLQEENQRLKKLVADLSLDREMLQEVIRSKL